MKDCFFRRGGKRQISRSDEKSIEMMKIEGIEEYDQNWEFSAKLRVSTEIEYLDLDWPTNIGILLNIHMKLLLENKLTFLKYAHSQPIQ